jgi:hypothetical protein
LSLAKIKPRKVRNLLVQEKEKEELKKTLEEKL